ncbi:hypothetical protein C5167_030702 [Papaver somniferum]|nr:hypothetical protein C5167_030702 [Papaver somniferum]
MGNEAKQRFQQIQEAYAVLSDERNLTMLDYMIHYKKRTSTSKFPRGLSDFMQEMLSMMANARNQQNSFEDLQKMFHEITRGDSMQFHNEDDDKDTDQTASKRDRRTGSPSQFSSMPAPVYS